MRLIGKHLLSLLVIAIILAAGRFLLQQGTSLRHAHADLSALNSATAKAERARAQLSAAAEERAARALTMPQAQLDLRIAALQQSVALADAASPPAPALLRGGDQLAAYATARLTAELAQQELAFLLRLRDYSVAVSNRDSQLRSLAQRRREHSEAYVAYLALAAQKARLTPAERLWMEHSRTTDRWTMLEERLIAAGAASERARAAVERERQAIDAVGALGKRPAFHIDQRALDRATAELTQRLANARAAVDDNWVERVTGPVLRQLPLALGILLSGFAIHLLVKLLFYYVLAPLAGRCQPVRLTGGVKAGGTHANGVHDTASAVSQTVYLDAGQELLLLPDYLQSASAAASKSTKWLFDWRTPWTSLIAGMVMLTRVRTHSMNDAIVISSNADPLSEVALIAIAQGEALVFQPRALVGIIHHTAKPVRVERRWQLFSAHAWLTMQLRYLIFTGPVTLVVKGTRGVRVERAGQGRLISQAATLGFSPQLDYSTVRSATFIAYYMNRTALLDDQFAGDGVYVYAETPQRASTGFAGRGLEGVVDAVLKVFGI